MQAICSPLNFNPLSVCRVGSAKAKEKANPNPKQRQLCQANPWRAFGAIQASHSSDLMTFCLSKAGSFSPLLSSTVLSIFRFNSRYCYVPSTILVPGAGSMTTLCLNPRRPSNLTTSGVGGIWRPIQPNSNSNSQTGEHQAR